MTLNNDDISDADIEQFADGLFETIVMLTKLHSKGIGFSRLIEMVIKKNHLNDVAIENFAKTLLNGYTLFSNKHSQGLGIIPAIEGTRIINHLKYCREQEIEAS